jgi:hypothetical protein
MNKWQVVLVVVMAFGAGAALSASALSRESAAEGRMAKQEPVIDTSEIFKRLKSADPFERGSAAVELRRLHDDVTARLLNIASTPKPQYSLHDSRQLSVELLTRFHSPETIPLLINHVDYLQPDMRVTEHNRLNGFPCARALRHFGQQGTVGIIEYLWQKPTEEITYKQNELFALVFIQVYGAPGEVGGGPKEAIAVIERARDRAFGQRAKDNCQLLLDKVKELTKGGPGVTP